MSNVDPTARASALVGVTSTSVVSHSFCFSPSSMSDHAAHLRSIFDVHQPDPAPNKPV